MSDSADAATADAASAKTGAALAKVTAQVAVEGQVFTMPALTMVRFGSGGNWVERTVPANMAVMCHVDVFGNPGVPAPRVCESVTETAVAPLAPAPSPAPAPAPAPTTAAASSSAKVANEGAVFKLATQSMVRFGSGTHWSQRTVPANMAVMCHVDVFGNPGVPAPRTCETVGTAAPAPAPAAAPAPAPAPAPTPAPTPAPAASSAKVANEGDVFKLATQAMVRFGAGSNWTQRTVPANMPVMCHVDVFGNPGVPAPRTCETVGTAAPAPAPAPAAAAPAPAPAPVTSAPAPVVSAPAPVASAPAPAPAAAGSALAGDVVDASGNVVASAYTGMAAVMSKAAGLAYRYGPDAASYGTTVSQTLYGPRGNNNFPEYPYTWQIGARTGDAGPYSTNQANLIFEADNPSQRVGVTDFQVSGFMYNTFAQLPQLSWTIAAAPGGGLDSLNVMAYKASGVVTGDPIAMARCGGRAGFCSQGLVAFQNGVIGTVGSNTAQNDATVKLPANKVPTAMAMTNDSEFALVTVWDTTALKGQLAVVALAGLCDGCNPYSNGNPRAWYDWWHEWMGVYPGLANMGNIAFMKILGYVDLPGMAAPTEIAVTTGMDQFQTIMVGGNFIGLENPLTNQANRQNFLNGGFSGKYAKGGVAVVISKSEQKATFIDLKPLFSYVNSVYFGGDLATFNARMASLGQADGQWPYSFAQVPSQVPTVIKTVSLPARPTAVKTTIFGDTQRAWIATQDGTLRIFSLGGYAPGGVVASPTASAVAEVGTVTGVGRNPTSLGSSKGEPSDGNIEPNNQQVLVNSRGDRKISWVRFAANGNSGSIVRTLQDTRLADPIAVEDAENFANTGYVLSVADYAGKAIHNFRYGPVIFADGGSCPAGSGGCPVIPTGPVAIEYGGKMGLPGKPFQVNSANVP